MLSLLQNKRVFRQETENHDRYLIIPKDEIEKFLSLEYGVGIIKGDILYPSKWHVFGVNAPSFIKKEEFLSTEYEYVFYPAKYMVKELQEKLNQISSFNLNNEFENLLKINELPEEIEETLVNILNEEDEFNLDSFLVEVFQFKKGNETYFLNLNIDTSDDGITYEYTKDFMNQVIVSEFIQEKDGLIDYLYKTVPQAHKEKGIIDFSSEEKWYHVTNHNSDFPLSIMTEILEMEDLIPFTSFKKESKNLV